MSPTQVPSTAAQAIDTYSVFDILNIFRTCWFLNRDHLLLLVTYAQKADAGSWTLTAAGYVFCHIPKKERYQ